MGKRALVLGLAAVAASWAFVMPDLRSARPARGFGRLLKAPDTDPAFVKLVAVGTVEALAMSVIGTVLALGMALPFLYAATRTMMISDASTPPWRRAVFVTARAALAVFRSIPELVWAMLLVLLVGLGPLPAVLALAIHTAGVFGKIFAELLEEVRPEPQAAIAGTGAGGGAVFAYGALGQVVPQLVAFALYRWEVNIRMATLFGFVGAGALGKLIYESASLFHFDRVATLVIAVVAVVLAVDLASGWLRRRLIG
jgi:phosphonate transport system permease protein